MSIVAISLLALVPIASAQSDRVELWTEDVLHLAEEMERLHPDLFFGVPREEFEGAVDGLLGRIEALSDDEVAVEVMRLVALPTLQGRDGHTAVLPISFHVLPLQLYVFEDGWFVVEARAEQAHLVGAQVLAIGGKPIEDVAHAVAPLMTRDNDWNLRTKLPFYLSLVEVLVALGFAEKGEEVTLSLRMSDGRESDVTLAGIPIGEVMGPNGPPHLLPTLPGVRGLRDRDRAWWMEIVPEARALYVQYNAVSPASSEGELVGDFGARIGRTFEEERLERVVLDLRSNSGGDNTTFGPLIQALKEHEAINREGRFFALIGRATFSAAGNFVTVLQRDTNAILVGEPTGGAPNQYGDGEPVTLVHHPDLLVFVATRYHAFGGSNDTRLTHEPDLAVPLRSADYFAEGDPALDAALRYEPDR